MEITTAHAHISTASADCDGPMYRDYIVQVSDEAKAKSAACGGINDFWEIEFRDSILTSQVSLTTLFDGQRGQLEVTEHGFTWHRDTDEGYERSEVTWCDDEGCDPETSSQRDIYAEMMGY